MQLPASVIVPSPRNMYAHIAHTQRAVDRHRREGKQGSRQHTTVMTAAMDCGDELGLANHRESEDEVEMKYISGTRSRGQ